MRINQAVAKVKLIHVNDLNANPYNIMFSTGNRKSFSCSGIYVLFDEGCQPLYVGQSVDAHTRLLAHLNKGLIPFSMMVMMPLPLDQLDDYEHQLIRKINPPFNGKFRRDVPTKDYCSFTVEWLQKVLYRHVHERDFKNAEDIKFWFHMSKHLQRLAKKYRVA